LGMGMAEPPIRPQIGGLWRLSRARNRAQFACLDRVFTLRVGWASDDVAQFALRLRQQSHHDVPALRSAWNVVDVLADLEVVHGVARCLGRVLINRIKLSFSDLRSAAEFFAPLAANDSTKGKYNLGSCTVYAGSGVDRQLSIEL
jgi:hypothetical protein